MFRFEHHPHPTHYPATIFPILQTVRSHASILLLGPPVGLGRAIDEPCGRFYRSHVWVLPPPARRRDIWFSEGILERARIHHYRDEVLEEKEGRRRGRATCAADAKVVGRASVYVGVCSVWTTEADFISCILYFSVKYGQRENFYELGSHRFQELIDIFICAIPLSNPGE